MANSAMSDRASFPDFPSTYWATLTHHEHQAPTNLTINTELQRITQNHVDPDRHDAAYFSDFAYHKTIVSPGTRTCSSLLSRMLQPSADSRATSPATTHVDSLSDNGSFSTHSTPPLQATPPKRHSVSVSFAQETKVSPQKPAACISLSETTTATTGPRAARHISFGGVIAPRSEGRLSSEQASETDDSKDYSGEATPTAKRCIQFAAGGPSAVVSHHPARRLPSDVEHPSDDGSATSSMRPTSIRFASTSSQAIKSVNSSRKSSYSEGHAVSGDELSRTRSIQHSGNSSPVLVARAGPATCKSTLDNVLKKEAIAKVIETVPEEEEDEDDDGEDDDEEAQDDIEEADDNDIASVLELDSDDDGYQEDIESDDDILGADVYPVVQVASATPRAVFTGRIDIAGIKKAKAIPEEVSTPVYRTAAPSESDLPDTTDFAPGNMDEDQPACIAFDMAMRDREARRRPAKPSDIDPTFPDSGTDDSDLEQTSLLVEETKLGKTICRSPPMQQKSMCRLRWNSPPLAKVVDAQRARSLPRRYLTGRKGLYAPKPQRAVTIKQSNEQRAQRRREKKEVRQNLRRGQKQPVDHNGHEKMKTHCLSRRKLIANENPCVIRPVMSI